MDAIFNASPPPPWSESQSILGTAASSLTMKIDPTGASAVKPSMCSFDGRIFLSWPTYALSSTPPSTFSFTTWKGSDDGWHPPQCVALQPSTFQAFPSALVVFGGSLYAFVPYRTQFLSSDGGGLSIYQYDGNTFQHVCNWGQTWCSPITAITCNGRLIVVAMDALNDPRSPCNLVWSCSNEGVTTVNSVTSFSGFSNNAQVGESTYFNPSLMERGGQVSLFFLAANEDRPILQTVLNDDNTWSRVTSNLNESGDSGVSAAATPDGAHAWLCFKIHGGATNLVCHWSSKGTAGWSQNKSMGWSLILQTVNEAALLQFGDWLYAVWNTSIGNTLCYSRRPIGHLPLNGWMGQLVDQNVSLSSLSIPGTHDSATFAFDDGIIRSGFVRCQEMTINEQLDAGIRYFDIRAGLDSDVTTLPDVNTMKAYHGSEELKITIGEIFNHFYGWLIDNPTEAIIAQIKSDNGDSQLVSNALYQLITEKKRSSSWAVSNTIPTLNDIVGKIQLVRRFLMPKDNNGNPVSAFGIDVTNWSDNNPSFSIDYPVASTTVSLMISDQYKFVTNGSEALEEKTKTIESFIGQADSFAQDDTEPDSTWYIGYSSFVTDWGVSSNGYLDGLPDTNHSYATRMNNQVEDIILGFKGGLNRCGTVVMDYPEIPSGDLIGRIIYTNKFKIGNP